MNTTARKTLLEEASQIVARAKAQGWISLAPVIPPAASPANASLQAACVDPRFSFEAMVNSVTGNTPDEILASVSEITGLPAEKILERRAGVPRAPFTRARIITAYLIRTRVGLTFEAIGRFMNGRNHSAIVHLCHQTDHPCFTPSVPSNP